MALRLCILIVFLFFSFANSGILNSDAISMDTNVIRDESSFAINQPYCPSDIIFTSKTTDQYGAFYINSDSYFSNPLFLIDGSRENGKYIHQFTQSSLNIQNVQVNNALSRETLTLDSNCQKKNFNGFSVDDYFEITEFPNQPFLFFKLASLYSFGTIQINYGGSQQKVYLPREFPVKIGGLNTYLFKYIKQNNSDTPVKIEFESFTKEASVSPFINDIINKYSITMEVVFNKTIGQMILGPTTPNTDFYEKVIDDSVLFNFTVQLDNYQDIAFLEFKVGETTLFIDRDIRTKFYRKLFSIPHSSLNNLQDYLFINAISKNGASNTIKSSSINNYLDGLIKTVQNGVNGNLPIKTQNSKGVYVQFRNQISNTPFFYLPKPTVQSLNPKLQSNFLFYTLADYTSYASYPFGYNNVTLSRTLNNFIDYRLSVLSNFQPIDYLYQSCNSIESIQLGGTSDQVIDLLPPIVRIQWVKPTPFYDSHQLFVSIKDTSGIGMNCIIQHGNQNIKLSSPYKYNRGGENDLYLVPFKYNPLYCNEIFNLNCRDIGGNYISLNSTSNYLRSTIPMFPNLECPSDNIYKSKVTFINYYWSGTSVQVYVFINGIIDDIKDPKLQTYTDYEGEHLQQEYGLQVQVDKKSSTLLSTSIETSGFTQEITLYFGVTYSNSDSTISLKFKPTDIDYFTKTYNTDSSTIPSANSINIKTSEYYSTSGNFYSKLSGQAPFTISTTGSVSADNSLLTGFKNMTLVYKSSNLPNPVRFIWTGQTGGFTLGTISTNEPYIVYMEKLCDNSNCETYPSNGFSRSNLDYTNNNQYVSNTIDYVEVSMSTQQIDVTKSPGDRTFTFSIKVTSQTDLSNNSYPYFYITENYSNDQLKFEMTPFFAYPCKTQLFTVTVEIPLNFGFRGVSLSVWGIIDVNGNTYGKYLDDIQLTILYPNQELLISDIFYDLATPGYLQIKGSGLGNLNTVGYELKLNNINQNYVPVYSGMVYIPIDTDTMDYGVFSLKIGNEEAKAVKFIGCSTQINCKNGGVCESGSCKCNNGFGGVDCSLNMDNGCKNNCSNHGTCNMRLCSCDSGYNGPSCEFEIAKNMNMSMTTTQKDTAQPMILFSNFKSSSENTSESLSSDSKNTQFKVHIKSIVEIDYTGKSVKTFNLESSSNWTVLNSSELVTHYSASENLPFKVHVKIQGFLNSTTVHWANRSHNLPENSIKYTVRIEDYSFSSTLNKLSLIWETMSIAPCPDYNQNLTNWGKSSDSDMKWFQIQQNQMNFYGTFSNLVVLNDDKILACPNTVVSDTQPLLISTEIPYFYQSAEIDPNFSVLVDYTKENTNTGQCGNESKKSYLKLALIIVFSVVGASLLIAGAIILVKKNSYVRLRILKLKSYQSTLSMRSLKEKH
eukprot:gene2118-2608_t